MLGLLGCDISRLGCLIGLGRFEGFCGGVGWNGIGWGDWRIGRVLVVSV